MKSMRFAGIEVCYIPSTQRITTKDRQMLKGNYTKLLATLSAMLTFVISQANVYASSTDGPSYDESLGLGLPKIAQAEELVLDYGFALGRLVCVVMCIFEIVKSIKNGDANAFWGIILKYAIALASFKLLPFIFDMIAGFFS